VKRIRTMVVLAAAIVATVVLAGCAKPTPTPVFASVLTPTPTPDPWCQYKYRSLAPPILLEGWKLVDLRAALVEGPGVDIEKEGVTRMDGLKIRRVTARAAPGILVIEIRMRWGPFASSTLEYVGQTLCAGWAVTLSADSRGCLIYLPPGAEGLLDTIPYPEEGWPGIVVRISNPVSIPTPAPTWTPYPQ